VKNLEISDKKQLDEATSMIGSLNDEITGLNTTLAKSRADVENLKK
jgi:hypothetical protein